MSTDSNRPVKLHQLAPGTLLFKRYRINEILGEGGFGITYSATDEVLLQDVAIKEYFPSTIATRNTQTSTEIQTISNEEDEQFSKGKQDFLKEARTLARFPHDTGIVAVRDYFEENNTAYIVMELLAGTDLRTWLIERGPMSAEQCFSLLSPIMTSLSHVHGQGLIHRDISPSNIMITSDGSARLLDFGAARSINKNGDLTLSVLLKPGYSPEEQYRSKGVQGPWTDVYSLCATFYRMLTGMQPEDSLQRLLLDELKKPSELGIEVPPAVEAVLMKGLSINGKDRYQTMDELRDAFETAFKDGVGPAETGSGKNKNTTEKKDMTGKKAASGPVSKGSPDQKIIKNARDPKKTGILIAVLAAAAVLILIPVIRSQKAGAVSEEKTAGTVQEATAGSSAANGTGQTAAEDPSEAASSVTEETKSASSPASEQSPDTENTGSPIVYPDDKGKLTKNILWGSYTCAKSNFSSYMKYMDIQTDAGTYNVSVVPYNLIVMPDIDPDIIILEFLDQFDVKIGVYGTFELNGTKLNVSAPDRSDIKELLTETELCGNTELLALSDALMFQLSFGPSGKDAIGSLRLSNVKVFRDIYCYYNNYTETNSSSDQPCQIFGALSGSSSYRDLQFAQISYDQETKTGTAVLGFTDGGITRDAEVSSYYKGSSVTVTYKKIQREYNGRTEIFDVNEYIRLNLTNGCPYGFTVYDEDTGTYHYYQDVSGQDVSLPD